MNIKQTQIAKMAGQMPGNIAAQGNQVKAQNTTNLQDAIAQAAKVPAPANTTTSVATTLGAQAAQAVGQVDAAAAQQVGQNTVSAGQNMLEEGAKAAALRQQSKALETQKQNRQQGETLANLSSQLKQKLVDENMTFQKDELGRTLFNDQQLLDYKISQGMDDQQLAEYEQMTHQMSERRLQMLATAQAHIKQELQNTFAQSQNEQDQEQQKFLIEKQRQVEEKMRKEKAKAANRAAMYSAAGTIIGAAAGSFGGPAGAAAGASVGGGLGSIAAGSSS